MNEETPNCWNCKQLTDAFLAVNPHRKGFAKCNSCIKEMQENGFVFLELPYDPYEQREDFNPPPVTF